MVETARGPKDFQYDQVFTPDHGQEKVFEDTNVSATISTQIIITALHQLYMFCSIWGEE